MPTAPARPDPTPPTEPPGARRWFTDADQPAVRDLWAVYESCFEQIEDLEEPLLSGVRPALREAVTTGDWGVYEDLLARRDARSTGVGAGLVQALTPRLVHAYVAHPERLIAVLDVLSRFVARRTLVLAEADVRARRIASRTTEESLAITLESIGDGVIATDARGRIDRMNPIAQQLSMWSLEEAKGRRLDEVFRVLDEDTGQIVSSRAEDVIRRGISVHLPKRSALVARDGSVRPIADSMAPIRDDHGTIHGVVMVFRDLSQERAREQEIETGRARTASILEASLDGVLVIDQTGLVTDANGAAERMFGRTELTGERFPDLLRHPSGRAVDLEALAASLGTRREMRAVRDGGVVFPVDVAIVRISTDERVSFTCFVRDLTESKAAQRALTESHQQLRSLAGRIESCREEERTRIARELHDELGQQLTAIRMDIGWLTPRQRTPEVAERLEAMSELVDSTFAAVRRLGTELRPGILDDLGLVDAIEWQANEFEERSGIRVNVEFSGEIEHVDSGRSTAVFRIFQEVLTNVARHSGANNVTGRLAVEGDRIALEVVDDGQGIRDDDVTHATSLGLLGMRERATLCGGTFRIEPAESGGTRVAVSLPMTEGETP